MDYVFEATVGLKRQDFATAEEAIAHCEASGHPECNVVKFRLEPNMTDCLPAFVHRSLDLWTLRNGVWRAHYIHDGAGAPVCEEKPH